MSNRTVAIAFAAITGCVSIFGITSASANPASAATGSTADECLSGPKATTPAGAHWYYRIEKGTKRKCWYLGDAGGKTKKAAVTPPATSDAAEEDAPPPTEITPSPKQEAVKKPIRKSVANARAELTTGMNDDPSLAETTWPPMPGPAANAEVRNDNQAAAMQPAPEVNRQGWNVATRWPEPTTTASDQPAAMPQQPAQPAPALTAERLATAAATPAPTPAPAMTTGAATPQQQPSTPAVDSEGMSIRILRSIFVGVLALAAILGPLLFKYFRPKPREDERTYGQRRQIWDLNVSHATIPQDNPPLVLPLGHAHDHHAHAWSEPRVLDNDTADEIEQLLARVSKRSAA
ncbi:MAG TPA: hypothetical protein VF499_09030 [Afipia sp.]